jgi:hypothetical protein
MQQPTSQVAWYLPAIVTLAGVVFGALLTFCGVIFSQWQQGKRDEKTHQRQLERDRSADRRALRDAQRERREAIYREGFAIVFLSLDWVDDLIHNIERYRTGAWSDEMRQRDADFYTRLRRLRALAAPEFGAVSPFEEFVIPVLLCHTRARRGAVH